VWSLPAATRRAGSGAAAALLRQGDAMRAEPYDWDNVREHILEAVFPGPSADEAVAMVGLLFDYRVVFSEELQHLTEKVEGEALISMHPYDAPTSASCVAKLFGLDADELLCGFQKSWRHVKESEVFCRVRRAFEGHRFVGRLEQCRDVAGRDR
jgi:hypothetical protein